MCRRHTPSRGIGSVPVLAAEDEPRMAAADRDGLRREAIAERIVAAGCDNQVGGSGRRPRRATHRPRSGGRRSSRFSLADVSSGEWPWYWTVLSAPGAEEDEDADNRTAARAGPR